MDHNRPISHKFVGRKEIYIFPLLVLLVIYCARAIVAYPFPESLLLLFVPIGLVVFLICDIHVGIGIWYFMSALGNNLEIDLPGIPPLRPGHIGLFLLLAVWFIKSYREVFSAMTRFPRTAKNRILLVMLGWITLSMVMGRLQGVTIYPVEYQFNAWLNFVPVILLPLMVSNNMNDQFVKTMVWLIVAFNTASIIFVIVFGLAKGVGLTGWKTFDIQDKEIIGYWVYGSPLLLALVFFRQQKWWSKALFSVAIAVSIVFSLLMIVSGHRSSALMLLSTLMFFLLLTEGRMFMIFALLIVLPLVALNTSAIQSWVAYEIEQTGSRISLVEDAIEIIKRHPLWGTGFDFYRLHSDVKLISPGGIVKPAATPHNAWLQVAADHGIPALFLLVAFCGYAFRDAWRLLHSSPKGFPQKYALFFLCTLSVAIVNSFISSGQILPVFTGSEGGEASILAGILLNFWFHYGLLLGFEKRENGRTND